MPSPTLWTKPHAKPARQICWCLSLKERSTPKKLGNEQFLAKANPDVVAEQRQKLEDVRLAVTKLTQALDRLKGL